MAIILSGKELSEKLTAEQKARVEELNKQGIHPGLAVVLVGEDPASHIYVRNKGIACETIGVYSRTIRLSETTTQAELEATIDELNADRKINGILVQLPLPKHINENKILYAINPDKDVDGFHPVNVGRIMIGEARFYPCTPFGVQQMLVRSGVTIEGADVVVVGRSNIVGKPIAAILLQKQAGANATVTVCHTGTKDLAFHTRRADILIVAAGRPGAVTAEMVKPGAVVIDVGVHRIGTTREGKAKLCGDVEFAGVSAKAGMITPVPGGVGPMTIAMLLANTLKAAKIQAGIPVG